MLALPSSNPSSPPNPSQTWAAIDANNFAGAPSLGVAAFKPALRESGSRLNLERVALGGVAPVIVLSGPAGIAADVMGALRQDFGINAISHSRVTTSVGDPKTQRIIFAFREPGDERTHQIDFSEIIRSVRRDGIPAVVWIGAENNTAYFVETLRSHLSLVPIVPITIVDPSVGGSQLAGPGNMGLALNSCTTLNPLRMSVAKDGPVIDFTTVQLIRARLNDAKITAAEVAARILRNVSLNSQDGYLPVAVLTYLEKILVPLAAANSVTVVLKGGVSIAALSPNSRPISYDIDFATRHTHRQFEQLRAFTKSLSTGDVSAFAEPGKGHSPKSTKLSGSVICEGREIQLDVVPVRRIGAGGFCFEFKYDTLMHQHRRIVTLSNGANISVIPPELNIAEKLVAARGPELGKFDLFDAAGLLTGHPILPHLFQRIVERQRLKPEIDKFDCEGALSKPNGLAAHIKSERLKQVIYKHYKAIDPNSLKKITLIDALIVGLSKTVETIDTPYRMNGFNKSIAIAWGRDAVLERADFLTQVLIDQAVLILTNKSVYVKRSAKSPERHPGFF